MTHDHIGLAFILTTLTLICAYLAWAERRRERDQELLALLDAEPYREHADQAIALTDPIPVIDHAELKALVTTADLPEDMRSNR